MAKLRVGVIRGGDGPEYQTSLKIGGFILAHLPRTYMPFDILITPKGGWHMWGIAATPEEAIRHADIFINCIIDSTGQNSEVQKTIEHFGKPYVGSSALARGLTHTRHIAREFLAKAGLRSPYHKVTYKDRDALDIASHIFKTISPPWRVRFANEFSHDNTHEARSYKELAAIINYMRMHERPIIIEEDIKGDGATCYVIEGTDGSPHILSVGEGTQEVRDMALAAHQALGLRHFSKSNFVVSPNRGAHITSVYAYPDLHEQSLLVKHLARDGISGEEYLDHILSLALGE